MAVIKVPGPISGKNYSAKIAGDSPTVDEQKKIDAFVSQREQAFQTEYAKRFGAPIDTGESTGIANYIGEVPKGLARGAVGLVESAGLGAAAALPESWEDWARSGIRRAAYEMSPQADIGLEDSAAGTVSEGIGSIAPIYAASFIPFAGPVIAGALSIGAGAGEASERARAAGATESERSSSALRGAGIGALDLIPVFGSVKKFLGPKATNKVVDYLLNVGMEGGEEAAQEATTQLLQNMVQKGYDPDQDLGEGTLASAGVGGIAGALIAALFPGRTRGIVPAAGEQGATPPKTAPTTPPATPSTALTVPKVVTPAILEEEGLQNSLVYKDLVAGKLTGPQAHDRLLTLLQNPATPEKSRENIQRALARPDVVPLLPAPAEGLSAVDANIDEAPQEEAAAEQAAGVPVEAAVPKVEDGWKLHLNPVPGSEQAISDYLKEKGIPHKVGQNSGQAGKGITVYVGARDAANAAAADLNSKFTDVLKDAEGDALVDDTPIAGKVWGRFDAPNSSEFHQYGESGVPFLAEDMGQLNFVEDREAYLPEAYKRADGALRKKYGTYYTGTPVEQAAEETAAAKEAPVETIAPKKTRARKVKPEVQNGEAVNPEAVGASPENAGLGPEVGGAVPAAAEPAQGAQEPIAGGVGEPADVADGLGAPAGEQPGALSTEGETTYRPVMPNLGITANSGVVTPNARLYPPSAATAPEARGLTANVSTILDTLARMKAIGLENAEKALTVHKEVVEARAVEHAKKAEAAATGAGAIYKKLFDDEQPTAEQEQEIPNILTEADVRKITDLFPLKSGAPVTQSQKKGGNLQNAAAVYFERYRNPMAALRRIAEDIYNKAVFSENRGDSEADTTASNLLYKGTGEATASNALEWVEQNLSAKATLAVDSLIGHWVETQEQRYIRRVTKNVKSDEMRGEIVEQLNAGLAKAINANTRTEANATLDLATSVASRNAPSGGVSLGGGRYASSLTPEQIAAAKAAAQEKAGNARVFLRDNPGVKSAKARFDATMREEADIDAVANKIREANAKKRADDLRINDEINRLQSRMPSATMSLEQMLASHVQSFLANNNLRAALDGIARASTDPRLSKLAMRLRALVKNTQVRMVDSLFSADGRLMAAAYDPATDTILFNRSVPEAMTNVTVLHEVVHAITHKALNTPGLPITQQLKKLFEDAQAALGPGTVGTDSIHEFVAEAFSNQAFRDALESTYPNGGKVSAWARFKNAVGNFVRRIFGAPAKPLGSSVDALDTILDQLLDTSSDATGGLRPDPDQGMLYRAATSPKAAANLAANLGRAQKQRFAQPTIANREKWAERASSLFDRFRDIVPSGALGLLKMQSVADIAKRMEIDGAFELNSAIEEMAGASYAGDQQANAILQAATDFVTRFPDRKVTFDTIVWESTTEGVDPRHPDDYYAKSYLRYAPNGDFSNAIYVGFSTGAERTAAIAKLRAKYGKDNVKQSHNPNMKKDAIHKKLRSQWKTLGKEGQGLYDNMAKFYKARFIELRDGFGAQIDAALTLSASELSALNARARTEDAQAAQLLETAKKNNLAADQLKRGIYERFFDFNAIEPYFPLVRKGDYWLEYTVKNPDTAEDEQILETFETSYARAQAMAELKNVPGIAADANGDPLDVKVYRRTDLNSRNIGPADSLFMRDIIQALAARNVAPEVINDVSKMFIDALPETSFAKSLQKRKNVQGAITDAAEAFRLKAFSLSNQATRYKFATKIRGETDKIALQARGATSNDPTKLGIIQELVARGQMAVNPPTGFAHDLAKAGTQFAFLQTLGFNVSSSIVEMGSIPIVAQPYLSGIYGFKKTSNAIYDAYKLFFNSGFNREMSLMSEYDGSDTVMMRASPSMDNYFVLKNVGGVPTYALRDDLKVPDKLKAQLNDMLPFVKLMADTGNLNRSAIYDTIGIEAGGVTTNNLQKLAKAVGYLQHMSGRSNRQVTAMAGYMLELERMRTNPTAAEKAMTDAQKQDAAGKKALYMTTDINGSHSLATGPRYAQTALGRLIMMYKNYGLHMATLQAKLANQVVRGLWPSASPEDVALRKIAFRQLMGMQLSSALFAGISGVPIYGLIKSIWALWNKLFGDEINDPDTITRQYIGDTAFRGPITDILGINISSRVGLNDLLIRDNPYLTDASAADYFMGYLGGPVWSTGTQVARGMGEIGSALTGGMGNFERGVETILPAAFAGPMKTMRYMIEGGANTRRGDPIYDNMGAGEFVGQLLGFKPAGLAKTQEITRELSRENALVTKEKDDLMRRLNMARRFGDYNERQAIEKEIQEFNARRASQFPKLRITGETKQDSWDAYQRKTADMYNGVSFSASTRDALKAIGNDMLGTTE